MDWTLGKNQSKIDKVNKYSYSTGKHHVQPLHSLVALDHAVHAVYKQHELPQSPQNVIYIIVLFSVTGHLDQALQAVLVHELVHEVLIVLEELLEQEERAAQLGVLRVEDFLNASVNADWKLGAKQDRCPFIVFDLVEFVWLIVQRLFQVQISAVLGIWSILSVDLQRTVLDLRKYQKIIQNYFHAVLKNSRPV